MKRSLFPIILAILLIGSVLLGLRDKDISAADTNIPNNNEVTSSVSSNSSATATITITMTGALNE